MANRKLLTDDQIIALKTDLNAGMIQTKAAKKYKISRSYVSDIQCGRSHADIGPTTTSKRTGPPPESFDPTDDKILELQSEVEHLRVERNDAKRALKAAAKEHGLFLAIADELEDKIVPMRPLPSAIKLPSNRKHGDVTEHLVMHISDGHHDQVVNPEMVGYLEEYNFPISVARAERYVDAVIKWTQVTLKPQFHFPDITILCYGDHTSGEIHGHVERSYFKNIFKNTLAIGQLHALMFRELAQYFEQVNVVYVPGNHGRRSNKKNYHGAHDNWDYLIAKTAQQYCGDMGNVDFTILNSFSINLDIGGVGFCVFHGDDIRSNLGIPWYGLERRQRRIMGLDRHMAGPPIRYYCCGHFHRPGTTMEMDGELMINGAWVATDPYAFNAFSGFTEPTQLLHGVNKKYGVTWRLPVRLRRPSVDAAGPQRYKIDMLEEIQV
jgi:hypothetical protein